MMKQFLCIVCAVFILGAPGCKSDSSTGPTNPNPAGVVITIATQAGQNGGVVFAAKANMDIKGTRVIVTLAAQHFADTLVNPTPTAVYTKDTYYSVNEYTGVLSGQQWAFAFTGVVAANNAPYLVNVNYTVP